MMYEGILEQDSLPVVPPGCSSEKPETFQDFIVKGKAALVSVGIVKETIIGNGKDSGKSVCGIVDSDMNDVGRVLNRLLGLPPEIQNRLFELFFSIFDLVQNARFEGNFDSGIVDMKASSIELQETPKTVHVDKMLGASTMLFTFTLDRGITWEAYLLPPKWINVHAWPQMQAWRFLYCWQKTTGSKCIGRPYPSCLGNNREGPFQAGPAKP